MKGVVNQDFNFIFVTNNEIYDGSSNIEEDELIVFDKGDVVEILKTIHNAEEFISGVVYVVYNPKNNESISLDSSFVDLI